MADAFLDTTVFIDYIRGDVAAKALLEPFLSLTKRASYSSITVAEIWCGEGMKDRKQEIEYEAILQTMIEASLTGSIARRAGSWLRGCSRNAQRDFFADALIAATAAEHGEPIHTRNDKHMKRFYSNVLTY
jgi:tRNA(fMet)-specific endonuclease VapC